jgi:pyridoxamine-phosphate oxidase
MNRDILPNLRENYESPILEKTDLKADPFEQFNLWFSDALEANIKEPNAMTLATCSKDGKPSARIVLLKGIDEEGFIFYSNYLSRKAKDITENPNAALVFLWLDLNRQVRIEGKIEKVSKKTSEKYFQSRPKGSQIGAWASPQSQIIDNRDILESNVEKLNEKFADNEQLPLPEFWGGYRIVPDVIEFWQGQPSRLHDRLRYSREGEAKWKVERLAP